ncbi:hypothetical protein PUR71_38910 [Streptomyces sp. SP17BM10]|uniref:hypothetical protein n=1 Tax=Streptomyces sp. SP17BM10 TaxID=3002530 RepID=UPI002E7A7676|nr:hypothetical protein [Streptomyces sp. SP17BM10]MEE1788830.1 hypothetical protein [Streptomyces sp. SP17BM10]
MSRSALRPALGTAAALAALILTTPSALAASPSAPAPDRAHDAGVSVAVFGDDTLAEGQQLTVDELTRDHGVDPGLLQAYARGTTPDDSGADDPASDEPASDDSASDDAPDGAAALSPQLAGDPAYDLVASWTSKDHRTVNLRRGTATWGYTKIQQKHNLNVGAVRATTRYPEPGWPKQQSATTWNYLTLVNHVRCSGWLWWRTCKVVDFTHVQVTVNYGNVKGVITAYCIGYADRCPDWVKNAVNGA